MNVMSAEAKADFTAWSIPCTCASIVGDRGSAEDDIQSLLDECDRMQRNWDLADLGLPSKNGRTGRRKVKKSDANGSQIRDMLSWALARHQALDAKKATPRPTPREEANNVVIGGVGKGGLHGCKVQGRSPMVFNVTRVCSIFKPPRIIVREKRDLQSQQFEERLSTGALVEQTELIGDRLRYSRVSGSGPDTGWVSIRMAHKDLLVLMKPPLRHWRSELVPVLRSSSAQSERRPTVSLPRLPQPKSAPPVTGSGRQDQCRLPPL
eukprot:Skav210456  [mRNA]  locus=scaffold1297:278241:283607:+ [translate_table: standard]